MEADGSRGKASAFSAKMIPGYAFHGVTAVLALFLMFQALGS